MARPDTTVSALRLFTLERPAWTIEDAALGVSVGSAGRRFAALSEAELLTPKGSGCYRLGPAFIQYDRQIQLTDPLLRAAGPVMSDLVEFGPDGTTILLCRMVRDSVVCVHQVLGRGPQLLGDYVRGRPMPLFRGASSRIILAHLPARRLRKCSDAHAGEIGAAGLGTDWASFKAGLAGLRRARYAVTGHEIEPGRAGIAAPILDGGRRVLGSLDLVVAKPRTDQRLIGRLATLMIAAAGEIEAGLQYTPGGSGTAKAGNERD
jgi:DNA-binding IclR family transcriptional regulator